MMARVRGQRVIAAGQPDGCPGVEAYPQTKSEPSAAGPVWRGGAAKWANSSVFAKKRRSKQYGACSDVAGANTLDAPAFRLASKWGPPAKTQRSGFGGERRSKRYEACSDVAYRIDFDTKAPLTPLGVPFFDWQGVQKLYDKFTLASTVARAINVSRPNLSSIICLAFGENFTFICFPSKFLICLMS